MCVPLLLLTHTYLHIQTPHKIKAPLTTTTAATKATKGSKASSAKKKTTGKGSTAALLSSTLAAALHLSKHGLQPLFTVFGAGHAPYLRTLSLDGTNLGAEGTGALARAMGGNKGVRLTTLSLARCRIPLHALPTLAHGINAMLPSSATTTAYNEEAVVLTSLELSGNLFMLGAIAELSGEEHRCLVEFAASASPAGAAAALGCVHCLCFPCPHVSTCTCMHTH